MDLKNKHTVMVHAKLAICGESVYFCPRTFVSVSGSKCVKVCLPSLDPMLSFYWLYTTPFTFDFDPARKQ
jgi:hypothetical protein